MCPHPPPTSERPEAPRARGPPPLGRASPTRPGACVTASARVRRLEAQTREEREARARQGARARLPFPPPYPGRAGGRPRAWRPSPGEAGRRRLLRLRRRQALPEESRELERSREGPGVETARRRDVGGFQQDSAGRRSLSGPRRQPEREVVEPPPRDQVVVRVYDAVVAEAEEAGRVDLEVEVGRRPDRVTGRADKPDHLT